MFLPPANEVADRSCFQWYVHRSVQRGRGAGGSHVTITHDVLDITIQGPSCIGPLAPSPCTGPVRLTRYRDPPDLFNLDLTVHVQLGLHCTRTPLSPAMFNFVHYEACTLGKRVVGIPLECFLVIHCKPSRMY